MAEREKIIFGCVIAIYYLEISNYATNTIRSIALFRAPDGFACKAR